MSGNTSERTGNISKSWLAVILVVATSVIAIFAMRFVSEQLRQAREGVATSIKPPTAGKGVLTQADVVLAALRRAVIAGDARTVKTALQRGVAVDVRDRAGNTPLCTAAALGRIAVARVLLQAGADVNVKNKAGLTPLHAAADGRHLTMLLELLAAGADANARDAKGDSPDVRVARKHALGLRTCAIRQLLQIARMTRPAPRAAPASPR